MLEQIDHERRALFDVTSPYLAFKPPQRMSIAESAEQNFYIKQPGGVPGPWNPKETPYMVEPMNMLASRRHEGVCFVGPARTGKTAALLLGWLAHAVCNDPGDMLFLQMTQDKAREFSKTDIDRAIRNSPNLRAMMGGSQADNTHDKMFRHGMWLRIAWPTVSNVSGSTYRYAASTDYDRVPDDIDGEGALWNLMLKRVQTYLSRGMALAESSPGRPLEDPNWKPATPHEAPPTTGILGIYNQSDRRRFYWQCPMCSEHFEASPGLSLFGLPSEDTLLEIVREADLEALANEHNRVVCPHCRNMFGPRQKYDLNLGGTWVQDGLILTRKRELIGTSHESPIAGYWLGGVAAAYQSWRSLILRYLQGLRDYALTGSELALQVTTNTDQGMPYMSRLLANAARNTNDPGSRKEKSLLRYVVPDEARYLVACVDTQGGTNSRFVVQVHAVGKHGEKWLIDRYNITESKREGVGGGFAPLDPAAYAEDWDLLTEKCVRATYRTSVEGREMRVKLTVVDSGGEDGVTDKAYQWFRRLRRAGISSRVMLIKGVGRDMKANFPFIKETMVGGRNGKEKGDIPLYLINTNQLKDTVSTGLKRQFHGPGYIHIPEWVNQAFIDELKSEVRQPNGTWMQVRKRNEAWDLLVYCEAGCMRLGAERIKWEVIEFVPEWARPHEQNCEVITKEERREMQDDEIQQAAAAAPPTQEPSLRPARPARRVARSSYVGS